MPDAADRVFDPAPWGPALAAFGAVTQLTVQLYDRSGEFRLGPIPATPLFTLVAGDHAPVGFAECARDCLSQPDPHRVGIWKVPGLALVGTTLRLSEEVVGAALYLASCASSFTTGSVLAIDGGVP